MRLDRFDLNHPEQIMKKRFSLHFHISTLFLFVMILVGSTIGLLAYNAISNILLKSANDKSERIGFEVSSNLHGLLGPSGVAVRLLANSSITEATTLSERMKRLELLKQGLTDKGEVAGIYIGYESGDFFLLRPIRSDVERNKYNAPSETQFMVQSIEHKGSKLEGSYLFLDSAMRLLKVDQQPDYAKKYFPKHRPWYQSAIKYSGTVVTPPYLFFSNRKVGLTIANQADNRHSVVGVDIQLDAIGKTLEEQKISPNAKLAVLDDKGFVIALGEDTSLINDSAASGGEIQLKQLNEFNSPIFTKVFDILSQNLGFEDFNDTVKVGGEKWVVNIHSFKAGGESNFMLISAVPEIELLADGIQFKNNLLWAMAILFIVMIPVGLFLARSISKPIRFLVQETENIRELKLGESSHVDSRIHEISVLANSLKRLKNTVSAFISYIPRDLVTDLLKSDDGIQIGGESRYLTILFSDLKDFSALSEITPTRELLRRVSSYLKLMTYAIKEEGGTVDKFIGDSVMAFWGAPTLNPNHAFHSAVAAIKTKRRMVKLNAGLIAEGKPPLVVRIGINTDAVLVGNIGSEERLSYTVMGDGVNIASRLEGINKEFGTDIIISHSVFKEAGERLWVRPIDEITVKGRAGEILIYELLGIRDGDTETAPTATEEVLCELTRKAFDFYAAKKYESALVIYQELIDRFNDGLALVMAARCQTLISS
jgi:adenylate cyclase